MSSRADEENEQLRARIELLERDLERLRRAAAASSAGATAAPAEGLSGGDAAIAGSMSVGAPGDLTERAEAAARLRKSEERLREAQAVARLGSWEWDLRTNVVTRSAELCRIYGETEEAFHTTDGLAYARIHPDDRERARAVMERALATQSTYEVDYRILRSSGIGFLHIEGVIKRDAAGAVLRAIGTIQDPALSRSPEIARELQKHVEPRA
jgi:PAS domain-containing protein